MPPVDPGTQQNLIKFPPPLASSVEHHPSVYFSISKVLLDTSWSLASKFLWKPGFCLPGVFSGEVSEVNHEDQDTVLHQWSSSWISAWRGMLLETQVALMSLFTVPPPLMSWGRQQFVLLLQSKYKQPWGKQHAASILGFQLKFWNHTPALSLWLQIPPVCTFLSKCQFVIPSHAAVSRTFLRENTSCLSLAT